MRQQLLSLYEIQRIDLEIRDLDKRRDSIPAGLKDLESQLQALRVQEQTATNEREAVLKEVRGLESGVDAETQKLKKWERRLADIRNQREYLALNREVEGTKRQNRESEEKILELNTKRKQLDEQLAELKTKIDGIEATRTAEKDRVSAEQADVEALVKTETARREQLLHTVPKPLLAKYDAVRKKRMGVGLVPATAGSCQGCNMRLPPQLFIILQRVESIEQCPSCQRILFWEQLVNAPDKGGDQGKKGAEASP